MSKAITICRDSCGFARWQRSMLVTQEMLDSIVRTFIRELAHPDEEWQVRFIQTEDLEALMADETSREDEQQFEMKRTVRDQSYTFTVSVEQYVRDWLTNEIFNEPPEMYDWDEEYHSHFTQEGWE